MASSPSIVCQKWKLASAALMVAAALAGSSRADERDNSTPPAGAAGDVALHGRVLLPDGKPAAGANVYWLQLKRAEPPAKSEIWRRKK